MSNCRISSPLQYNLRLPRRLTRNVLSRVAYGEPTVDQRVFLSLDLSLSTRSTHLTVCLI